MNNGFARGSLNVSPFFFASRMQPDTWRYSPATLEMRYAYLMHLKRVPLAGLATERTYHSLFIAGLIAKAFISLGEIISGLALAFWSYDTLYSVVFTVFGGELMENPRDVVWEYVARGFQGFSDTPRSVWAFIFLSHGIVKIFLLTGLWHRKLWAYPASAIIFTIFVLYQFYQLNLT